MVWNHFAFLVEDCLILHLPDRKLLQHFWYGLWKDNAMRLNAFFEGSLCTWTLLREKRLWKPSKISAPPCIPIDEVPVRRNVEPPRLIVSRAEALSSG
jgi:hypothetical protein